MTDEEFSFYGKRTCSFLGVSRWTVQHYRKTGLLPDRTRFSEAELRACLEKLKPRKQPGAAERCNVARKQGNAKKPEVGAEPSVTPKTASPGAPGSTGEGGGAAPHPPSPAAPPPPAELPQGEPEKPPQAEPAKATRKADTCEGDSENHVDFPAGKPWKAKPGDPDSGPAKKSSDDDLKNGCGDWDFTQ